MSITNIFLQRDLKKNVCDDHDSHEIMIFAFLLLNEIYEQRITKNERFIFVIKFLNMYKIVLYAYCSMLQYFGYFNWRAHECS